ncbi:DUF6339 family protein [Nocardia carnea]|uniref:DUF6339 family protein n=1 Tax=Nocardia carnea TaxID=37328 RepID=UPI002455812D|nr:DUF6339 family protein [Nocardia carnea]
MLATEYRLLEPADLLARWTTGDESAVFVATGGTRVNEDKLQHLRELVVDLAKESGFPAEHSVDQRSDFDLKLARMLHQEMRIAPAEAAAGDVWAFIALVVLPDVSKWRYPSLVGDRVLGTDLTRHVFGRMWWRAQLVYTPSDPDPYAALHVLGEAAFDQIYARRNALGGSPHLIKSILRVWNALDFKALPERDILRDFLKRLLRLAPLVSFDALDETALQEELMNVAREAITGVLITVGVEPEEAHVRAIRAHTASPK